MQFLNQAGAAVNWAHLVIFGALDTGCGVWRTLRFSIEMTGNSKIARNHYEYLSILENIISFSRLARKFWPGGSRGQTLAVIQVVSDGTNVSMFPCLQRILTRTTNPRHISTHTSHAFLVNSAATTTACYNFGSWRTRPEKLLPWRRESLKVLRGES